MKPITLHVEGGPDRGKKTDLAEIRDAFRTFLDVPTSVRIVPQGPRSEAFKEFVKALHEEPERHHLLLVDSECAIEKDSPWQHVSLTTDDNWKKPKEATDKQLFFMAQCVEAWLVADGDQLKMFYGDKLGNLPKAKDIEQESKKSLMEALKRATRSTTKGEYHKTRHFPELLKLVRRDHVQERSHHCKRLLSELHGE